MNHVADSDLKKYDGPTCVVPRTTDVPILGVSQPGGRRARFP